MYGYPCLMLARPVQQSCQQSPAQLGIQWFIRQFYSFKTSSIAVNGGKSVQNPGSNLKTVQQIRPFLDKAIYHHDCPRFWCNLRRTHGAASVSTKTRPKWTAQNLGDQERPPPWWLRLGGSSFKKTHKNAKTIPVQEFKCSNSTRIIGPYGGTRFALPRP